MPHVDIKKWPCRAVECKYQEPLHALNYLPVCSMSSCVLQEVSLCRTSTETVQLPSGGGSLRHCLKGSKRLKMIVLSGRRLIWVHSWLYWGTIIFE